MKKRWQKTLKTIHLVKPKRRKHHHQSITIINATSISLPPPSIFRWKREKKRNPKVSLQHKLLHRYDIILWSVFASQNNTLEASWKNTFGPLAPSCNRFGGRDDHKHVVIPLNNSHYTNSASFFDVPTHKTSSVIPGYMQLIESN
jgi:hypothetical protein